ncbi:sensor histidine kinase [Chondrinema litorale]|uniref:sensor histidine kinase n=1 Tax=Chondrinema litorale TaxID=2994555 RepID=UPI00254323B1|nr:HAMP domain-containing sensor histidine kinase [Chondrinema litorale]UZR94740.1 HAMP domain-containing sensor histidine kinase [Chondrinema litorale]
MENEVLDSNLYIQKSQYAFLNEQEENHKQLVNDINAIIKNKEVNGLEITDELNEIQKGIKNSSVTFHTIVEKQIEKGFKNWGVIGEMRTHAHFLESRKLIPENLLLSLRRHEKDYLLRKEKAYQQNLIALSNQILNGLPPNGEAASVLKSYVASFNKIVVIDEAIGDFSSKRGLKYELLNIIAKNNETFESIINKAESSQNEIITTLKFIYIIFSIIIVITGLFLGYLLAYKISKPLRNLVFEINKTLGTENNFYLQLNYKNNSEEVKELHMAFNKLMNKINRQFTEIRKNNDQLELQNDALVKVNKELDHFVYSASHDLRAPIVTVKGLIGLIETEKDDEIKAEYLNKVNVSLDRLDHFITDILRISRNARVVPILSELNIRNLVEEIYENYEFEYPLKDFDKLIEIENESISIVSDVHRIKVILDNLVANSLRYHRAYSGKPFVKIHVKIDSDAILVKVSDNGIGILDKELPKIYDMFYRATDYKHGSGLGLYIVKEMLDRLDGEINVTSKVGKGTTFSVLFPNKASIQTNQNRYIKTTQGSLYTDN